MCVHELASDCGFRRSGWLVAEVAFVARADGHGTEELIVVQHRRVIEESRARNGHSTQLQEGLEEIIIHRYILISLCACTYIYLCEIRMSSSSLSRTGE